MPMAKVEPALAVFECDESYFVGRQGQARTRYSEARFVFDILNRGGEAYALPLADASSQALPTALRIRL